MTKPITSFLTKTVQILRTIVNNNKFKTYQIPEMVDTIVENYRKWNRRFKDVVKKKKKRLSFSRAFPMKIFRKRRLG